MRLECVFQGKLDGAVPVDGPRDLSEVAVGHATVRRRVVGDVEGVEQVGTEVEAVFMPEWEAFENCHVDILETWSTKRAWPHRAECVVGLLREHAVAIVLVGAA